MAAKDKNKKASEGEIEGESPDDQAADQPEETSEGSVASDREGADEASSDEGKGADEAKGGEEDEGDAPAAGHLGATRYVMTGFFLAIIAASYVVGRALGAVWGKLAETSWVHKSMPFLATVGEEERSEACVAVGAVLAVAVGIHAYRRADVRQWTDEVASELSKVTWPDKNEVTNSTIIVVVTSAFATFYLALLDRFWGFVTNLVYGS